MSHPIVPLLKEQLGGKSLPFHSLPQGVIPPDRADLGALSIRIPESPSAANLEDIGLTFLTINEKKAGTNNPSLDDIITVLDQHSPDFLI